VNSSARSLRSRSCRAKLEERADTRPMIRTCANPAAKAGRPIVAFIFARTVRRGRERQEAEPEIIVGKNRNGPEANVAPHVGGEFARFRDVAEAREDLTPDHGILGLRRVTAHAFDDC